MYPDASDEENIICSVKYIWRKLIIREFNISRFTMFCLREGCQAMPAIILIFRLNRYVI
jgi:hypothetical protein